MHWIIHALLWVALYVVAPLAVSFAVCFLLAFRSGLPSTWRWNAETDPRMPAWAVTATNRWPLLVPMQMVIPVLCLTCGFLAARNDRLVLARLDRGENPQMFSNGALMLRFMLPFWVGFQVRWSGAIDKPACLQVGLGWKINGRFAGTFRVNDDLGSAAGILAPNTDQAIAWHEGGK